MIGVGKNKSLEMCEYKQESTVRGGLSMKKNELGLMSFSRTNFTENPRKAIVKQLGHTRTK